MQTLCQQENHNWLSKNLGASSKAVLLLLFYIFNKNSDITAQLDDFYRFCNGNVDQNTKYIHKDMFHSDRKHFGISFLSCNTDVINNVSICALLACFTCLYIFCCCSDKGILTLFFSFTISHLQTLILFLLISLFPPVNETVQTVALRTK